MAVRRQLLNHMVDGISKARPNAVWAEIPKSVTSYASGYRRITYQNLANAVNGVAWWLYYSLGPGIQFETLAYFGPWDVRYVILLLGAVKAGYKVSLMSWWIRSPRVVRQTDSIRRCFSPLQITAM